MRRIIVLLVTVLICAMTVLPVCAAKPGFVPSVTYKDGPEVVDAKVGDSEATDCLVITSVKEAKDKTTDITQDARDLLVDAYTELRKEKVKLPLDYGYVVLDLVDVSFKQNDCIVPNHGHHEELEKDGTTLTVTFKMDVDKDTKLDVLVYVDGKWEKIQSVVNNGDGTVTCVFERICPVAFCVPADQYDGPTQTGDSSQIMLWVVLMLAALAGIVLVTILYLRSEKKK